jgi:hypothetical protein
MRIDPVQRHEPDAPIEVHLELYRQASQSFRNYLALRWGASFAVVTGCALVLQEGMKISITSKRIPYATAYVLLLLLLCALNVFFEIEFVKSWVYREKIERRLHDLLDQPIVSLTEFERLGHRNPHASTLPGNLLLALGCLLLAPPWYLLWPGISEDLCQPQGLCRALALGLPLVGIVGLRISYSVYRRRESALISELTRFRTSGSPGAYDGCAGPRK